MKKLSTSVSPFVMLIVPVLFAVLLSLGFNTNNNVDSELTTTVATQTAAQKLVKTGETTIIKFLMKK